jgi:hypothetical protein
MAESFIEDWSFKWDAIVLYYDAQRRRNRLTLIDTSSPGGAFQFAMHTSELGNAVMVWRDFNWHLSPLLPMD